MKAVVLAAGYATRLYPLTRDFPKPLLELGGRTLLDRLLDRLFELPPLDLVWVVTNRRFYPHFDRWRAATGARRGRVWLLEDGTISPETRLGAVGDLQLVIERTGLKDDLLVAAADNLLEFPLEGFLNAFRLRGTAHLGIHAVRDPERLRRTGVVELGADLRVLRFHEKPEHPPTCWAVPPLYVLPAGILPRVGEYLLQGGMPDAPGHLMAWLCEREPVYAWRLPGKVWDIGTPKALEEARRYWSRRRA